MIEQIVSLRFQFERKTFREFDVLRKVKADGVHLVSAHPRVASNVAVRSSKERCRGIVVKYPTNGAGCNWRSGIKINQAAIRKRGIGALSHGIHRCAAIARKGPASGHLAEK